MMQRKGVIKEMKRNFLIFQCKTNLFLDINMNGINEKILLFA